MVALPLVDSGPLVAACGFSLGGVFESPDSLVVGSSTLEFVLGFLLLGRRVGSGGRF